MPSRLLALLAAFVLLLPCISRAVDPVTIDASGLPDGEHAAVLTVKGGQVVDARPLRSIRLAPGGPTNPPPTSNTPLQVRVKQLTQEAITAGGSPTTAAKLAGVYALVSDFCLDGTASPEVVRGTADKPGLLSQATDAALKDAPDKDKWAAWRQGVGSELAARHPTTPTKEALAGTLREVSGAVRSHLGSSTAANGEKLTIPWAEIIELLRPIIRDLLLKLLADLINKGGA
jgi:hypothetical protein